MKDKEITGMAKKFFIVVFLCSIGTFLFQERLVAYSTEVHKEITKRIIKQNVISLNKSINNYTGFSNGVKESINKKFINEWIEDGSFAEDTTGGGLCTHFYNPLTNLSGVCGESTPSAYDWANTESNEWSWQKARDNFYDGLTLTKKIDREKSLAKAFKALGHVIHLLQDVAVPAHTRGDLHAIPPFSFLLLVGEDSYEHYTNKNISGLHYTQSLFGGSKTSVSPGAPRQFWDVDIYTTTTFPDGNAGLSEYTSYNFLSDGTIFKDMPYPKYSSESYEMYDVEHSVTKKRIYLRKKGDGELIEHFATYGPLSKHLSFDAELQYKSMKLDGKCHYDYAQKLIPRAVGYSAGLLNYFFRGDIDMIPDGESGSGYVIVNNTNEDMNGTFELWYDNKNDERLKVSGASWTLSINKKDPNNSKANKSVNITFTAPTDMKEENKYLMVFQGKLGNEQGAVVGKNVVVEKPIPAIVHATRGYDGYGVYIGYGLEVNIGDKQYTRAIYDDVVKAGERVVIKAVRFAEENPYIILLLSLHEQLSSGTGTYKVHKFTVNDDGITYGGIVKELPYYKEEFPRTQDVKTYENNYENSCMSQELKTDITFMIETSIRTTYNYQDLYVSREGIPTVFGTLARYKDERGYSSEKTYQSIRKEWCYNGTPACPWTETINIKYIYEIPSVPGIINGAIDFECEEFSYGEYSWVDAPASYSGVGRQTTWCSNEYSYEISGRTDDGRYYCGGRESQHKVIIDDIEGNEIGEGYTEIIPLSVSSYALLTTDGKVKLPDKTVPLDPGYNYNNTILHNMIFPGGYSIAVSELNKYWEYWESKIIKSITITPAEEFSCGTVSIFTNDKKDCFIINFAFYGDSQNYSTDCNSRCQTISKGDSWYSTYHVFDITFYKKR